MFSLVVGVALVVFQVLVFVLGLVSFSFPSAPYISLGVCVCCCGVWCVLCMCVFVLPVACLLFRGVVDCVDIERTACFNRKRSVGTVGSAHPCLHARLYWKLTTKDEYCTQERRKNYLNVVCLLFASNSLSRIHLFPFCSGVDGADVSDKGAQKTAGSGASEGGASAEQVCW